MADKFRFYRWPGTNDFVPSVTTICAVMAKPGLDRWKQEQAIKAAAWDIAEAGANLDGDPRLWLVDILAQNMPKWLAGAENASAEAMRIGIETHAHIEHFNNGHIFLPVENDPLPFELAMAYVQWFNRSVDRVLMAEQPVFCTGQQGLSNFAGTLDAVCLLKSDAIIYQTEHRQKLAEKQYVAIIDVKTSNDFYPEMGMQIAAYAASDTVEKMLADNNLLEVPLLFLTVRLDKKTKLAYVKTWEMQKSWHLFRAALNLWTGLNPSAAANYAKKQEQLHV